MSVVKEPIPIRAHTLLCLQGFRGEGYSPEFIQNMAQIHAYLQKNPKALVTPIMAPDIFCKSCPNLASSGCTLHGEGTEQSMGLQDQDVLQRLHLKPSHPIPWQNILEKIKSYITGSDLPKICGKCPWLPLGYCKEGMDTLRHS